MNLKSDWQQAIGDLFIERISEPFNWGFNDCALFAADCFRAATGTDPADGLRGTYSDAIGAVRVIDALGGLGAIASRHCGAPIDPAMASFGDIGIISNSGRPCLAVFGGQFFHAPGADGLKIFPVETCLQAWSLV